MVRSNAVPLLVWSCYTPESSPRRQTALALPVSFRSDTFPFTVGLENRWVQKPLSSEKRPSILVCATYNSVERSLRTWCLNASVIAMVFISRSCADDSKHPHS